MFKSLAKVLGFGGEKKKLKRLEEITKHVNSFEPRYQKMSDSELKKAMDKLRKRHENNESLDNLLPEVFAIIRETAKRTLNMRHFDVQIMGGIALFEGNIAEMKTGEGKTLAATLPVVLNSLSGKSCHIITVNDYLAKRDSEWMKPIYDFLGVKVGLLQNDMDPFLKEEAYKADVVFGTNAEFGFDYLRDNMVVDIDDKVQRGHDFAIVDEVDSILIDEARTPLIISGPAEKSTKIYRDFALVVPSFKKDRDYEVEEKTRTVWPTEEGMEKIEKAFNLDNIYQSSQNDNIDYVNHLTQALRAHGIFKKDVDYVINDGEIVIVDEFTGRLMTGRRYSEGLHQAIEAKEKVAIKEENQTLATITLQNYFRMYEKLAGMTGTASTEADEFMHIYKLDTYVIPTNKPMIRDDSSDIIYKTEEAKFKAVVDNIEERNKKGQPVLVGTVSIEKNELLSKLLKRRGIKHELLNAKHHEREAEIISQAGQKGAVTVATNMAGRGVDIVLGGMETENGEAQEIKEVGGLHVLGTERHEARRIDNQLRGRSGRQGDMGSSQFYLSTGDELMRLFAGDRIKGVMETFNFPEDQPIEHKIISNSIERAQKQVESQNFSIRKHVLEYDDVMNKQREIVYGERDKILEGKELDAMIDTFLDEVITEVIPRFASVQALPEDWDTKSLSHYLNGIFPIEIKSKEIKGLNYHGLVDLVKEKAQIALKNKREEFGEDNESILKSIMLQVIDNRWKSHLYELDYLKEGINLRAIGQRDPLVEFKAEAYNIFQNLINDIKEESLKFYFHVQKVVEPVSVLKNATSYEEPSITGTKTSSSGSIEYQQNRKIGRNEPCPCGSGKKYKKCCGQ